MDEKTFLSKLGSRLFAHPGFENLVALSTSSDGFKREDAVRRLGTLGDTRAIPYLVVRANDWVPQVRAAAFDALVRMLKSGNGNAFVASLPQILHLQSCSRGDHTALLEAIHEFLLREQNRDVLLAGMESPDSRVVRIVIRLMVDQQLMEPAELVTKGLAQSDVLVRSIVVNVLQRLTHDEFERLAHEALRDTYMPVRREVFQQLLRRLPKQGLVAARNFLFDRSASIREIAVQHLLSVGEPVDEIYADALRKDPGRAAVVKCALWGWALMNKVTRAEQVRQFLVSPIPAVRRAALSSIGRLLRIEAGPYLKNALADSSPAVCNEAARLIRTIGVAPGIETLMSIATSSGLTHVAYACCRVARDSNKWDWLRFVLGVYGSSACEISSEAFSREIDAWEWQFNRRHAQPTPHQLEEVVKMFVASRDRLSAGRAQLLAFTLRTYGAAV